jgi:hypothetical protein
MRTLFASVFLCWWTTSVSAGDCWLVSTACAEGPETRIVGGIEVYRECWRYESEYECLSPDTVEEPNCAVLRDNGCSQTGSSCIVHEDDLCTTYEQTYECPNTEPPVEQAVLDCGGQLFCLDGNCFDTGYDPNTNMGKVGAMLSVMQAMSDEMSVNTVEVFKGDSYRCGIPLTDKVGAFNCCDISGWAQGAFECSFTEKMLADLRDAKRCHYIGTYCAKKTDPGGICLLKKKTFCCFGSKLSRIIAEQARIQLGRAWGTSREPDCRGFTMDEITSLDFEAMDLSEFYADVITSMPTIDPDEMQERMTDRMNQLLP